MKKFTYLLVAVMCSFSVVVNEEDSENNLFEADIETVAYFHDYCSSQLDDSGEAQSENFILSCINNDLENSGYQTFSSYSQVKALLAPANGE